MGCLVWQHGQGSALPQQKRRKRRIFWSNVPRRNADDQGENARSVTVGHQDPIAQPGPVCQIEFQLIHIIGRPAALVASSYRPVSHCRHPELIAWEQAWAGEEVNAAAISGPRVFMPRLLADTDIVFVSIQGDDGIVGGGILNRGAEVVGLSNIFGSAIDVVWRSLMAMAGEIFPGLPLVGYEHGDELAAAHRAGFETVGPLRVWRLPGRVL